MRVQLRASSGGYGRPKEDESQAKIPRGLRMLPNAGTPRSDPRSELGKLQGEAAAIERWWKDPRWKHTTRIYSGKKGRTLICGAMESDAN